MIAKLRVGCTVAGCAPAVRTIVRRVLFHWITSSTDPAAESAYEAPHINGVVHMSASKVQNRSIGFSFQCVFSARLGKAIRARLRLSGPAYGEDFGNGGFIPSSHGGGARLARALDGVPPSV